MMSSNMSVYPVFSAVLTMETLKLAPPQNYPAFIFGTITYLSIVLCNTMILYVIVISKDLHKPMYILLFNMPLNDLVGATAFFPHMVSSLLSQNIFISHLACIFQAFLVHLYGAGALLILTAMAYDRYVAICKPLRYNSIFTNGYLIKLIVLMWTVDFSLIIILFTLLTRPKICRTEIMDPYCSNPALVRLTCGDTTMNNYYGLFITAFFQGLSLSVVIYTYLRILIACVSSANRTNARSKALQTCATHLAVFLIFEGTILFNVLSYRIQGLPIGLHKFFALMMLTFPPFVNPLIYGLKTKEIKQKITIVFSKNRITVH
ncbi:olfactory receptor 52K2-like [Alosa sapidissima]|uniref:olfactory receptor 52K2-like n=1 Tax=Alosa sapidissima TaxID=34773 RepID=UPI001C09933A|nr:olfactory receptor 52K2-like [Alosa sapidissima]